MDKQNIRRIIADYMQSEGCDCCRNIDEHNKNKALLAKILDVPKYKDGSGYNFNMFATKPTKVDE